MDTRFIRRLVRRRWRMTVAGGGLIGLLVLILSLLRTPTYQASTTLLVNQNRGLAAPSYESVLMSQQLTRTYAELLKKRPLYESVIANLQLGATPERLMRNVRVSTIRDTQLIVVTAYDRSPQRAADIANELVRLLREQDRQLLTGAYAGVERGLSIVEPARPDPIPASPKALRDTLLGLAFGLLGMAGIAVVREYIDESIKDGDEAAQATGAAVLGVIGNQAVREQRLSADAINGRRAEPYRMLAVRLRSALENRAAHSLMVTSAEPIPDTQMLAVHLSAIYAQLGQRVVLVDSDLRQPTLHSWFNAKGETGLHDLLKCDQPLPVYRYLLPTSIANLMLLPGGASTANPLVLFNSPRLGAIINELRQHADLIVIAAPALLTSSESLLLSRWIDAALLAVRAEATPRTAAAAARAILDQARIQLAGVVLTGAADEEMISFASASSLEAIAQPATRKRLFPSSLLTDSGKYHSAPASSASAAHPPEQ